MIAVSNSSLLPIRRTALVTGASRGLGAALARSLARAGLRVVLVARSREPLEAVVTGIHERSSSHFRLLLALADERLLEEAYRYADQIGLRGHELGDVSLIWAKRC